jgi:hypothetical protein
VSPCNVADMSRIDCRSKSVTDVHRSRLEAKGLCHTHVTQSRHSTLEHWFNVGHWMEVQVAAKTIGCREDNEGQVELVARGVTEVWSRCGANWPI